MTRFSIKAVTAAAAIAMGAASPVLADADGRISDTWTKASLTTTYALNRHLNPFDIAIDVEQGVVTLRGDVESEVERDLAETLAAGTDGVREVRNELRIRPADEAGPSADAQAETADRDDGRSFTRLVEDANLTAKVKSQLLWNSQTSGLAIDVDAHDGSVTLKGRVDSETEAQLAERIARDTDGVRDVDNRLHVGGEAVTLSDKAGEGLQEAGRTIGDGWITTKVKTALLYNRHVDGTDIEVTTDSGRVTLRGRVDSVLERDTAVEIARSIQGVTAVESRLAHPQ